MPRGERGVGRPGGDDLAGRVLDALFELQEGVEVGRELGKSERREEEEEERESGEHFSKGEKGEEYGKS